MRITPTALSLQIIGFLSYLGFLWLWPHHYGITVQHPHAWPWARLLTVVLCWLPLLVISWRGRYPSRLWPALIGAALPISVALYLGVQYLDTVSIAAGWSPRPYAMYDADSSRYYLGLHAAQFGTALTYAWLTLGYASFARRWWSGLLLGLGTLLAMLLIDGVVVFLGTVGMGRLG